MLIHLLSYIEITIFLRGGVHVSMNGPKITMQFNLQNVMISTIFFLLVLISIAYFYSGSQTMLCGTLGFCKDLPQVPWQKPIPMFDRSLL